MCGIVGAISQRNVVPILVDGLHRLEYRGYDSAGICVINSKQLHKVKREGKVRNLEEGITDAGLNGNVGIAHTRWATHGSPSQANAHPHVAGNRIAVVHNGIIENYLLLKKQLGPNVSLYSETDSEVIAALIYLEVSSGIKLLQAVQNVTKMLDGAFAIAVIDNQFPDEIIVARNGSPLTIGLGIAENFIASDPLALSKVTQDFIYLEDQDVAVVTANDVAIYDFNSSKVEREIHTRHFNHEATDKGKYRHYMQKEIFEQPTAIKSTLSGRISQGHVLEQAFGRKARDIFNRTKNIVIVACGTSYYASLVAKHWFENIAGISCQVEVASEFRYRKRVVPNNSLFITVSQSGETADTIAALQNIKAENSLSYSGTLAICNVPDSTLVRASELVFLTHAGPEIGVASTKAFITQLTSLLLLVLVIGSRSNLSQDQSAELVAQITTLPKLIEQFLLLDKQVQNVVEIFDHRPSALYLGRGELYPIALEGALKLKEISYIHAQAYPAGELKHGPLALVDKEMPVVVVAPNNELLDKLKSNIQEVQSRGGRLLIFAAASCNIQNTENVTVVTVPESPSILAPFLYTIPLQLLAYHVAVLRGTDVDQPRNLAKSVTVE